MTALLGAFHRRATETLAEFYNVGLLLHFDNNLTDVIGHVPVAASGYSFVTQGAGAIIGTASLLLNGSGAIQYAPADFADIAAPSNSEPFTFAFMMSTTVERETVIVDFGVGVNGGWNICTSPAGKTRCYSKYSNFDGSITINDGKPHYIRVTYDASGSASSFKVYVDGVLDQQFAPQQTLVPDGSAMLSIGLCPFSDWFTGENFVGVLDEMRFVRNQVLTGTVPKMPFPNS